MNILCVNNLFYGVSNFYDTSQYSSYSIKLQFFYILNNKTTIMLYHFISNKFYITLINHKTRIFIFQPFPTFLTSCKLSLFYSI